MTKYYKWVTNHFTSAFTGNYKKSQLIVQYGINRWVYPNIKDSQLMCFNDLSCAQAWKTATGFGRLLYECEVKNPQETGLFIYPQISDINYYWSLMNEDVSEEERESIKKAYYSKPPQGTIFCDAIKLIKPGETL